MLCGALVCAFSAGVTRRASAQPLRISVFGDSVLLGAAEEISASLPGDDVTIDAHENLSLLGSLATLAAARPTVGDVVVLDFGYNDGTDPTAWRDRLDRAAAILDGVPKVIWLAQREFADGRAAMNAELRDVAQEHPNIEVVDWNAIVAAHPDFVYGDGIHLTPAGRAGMAQVVRDRVDAFVAARIAATSTTVATTTTTASPTTTTSGRVAPRAGAGRSSHARRTGTGDDAGDALWLVPVVGGVLVAVAVALWVRSRPRRVRRRAE